MSESITQKQEQLALEPALTNQVIDQTQEVNTMNDHQAVRETEQNLAGDITNDRQTPILSAARTYDLPPRGVQGFDVFHKLILYPNYGQSSFLISDTQSLPGTPRTLAVTHYEWKVTGRWYVKNCGSNPITCEWW